MNEVALRANDVLRNDVMLRINEVALRANGYAIGVIFFIFLLTKRVYCVKLNLSDRLDKKQGVIIWKISPSR